MATSPESNIQGHVLFRPPPHPHDYLVKSHGKIQGREVWSVHIKATYILSPPTQEKRIKFQMNIVFNYQAASMIKQETVLRQSDLLHQPDLTIGGTYWTTFMPFPNPLGLCMCCATVYLCKWKHSEAMITDMYKMLAKHSTLYFIYVATLSWHQWMGSRGLMWSISTGKSLILQQPRSTPAWDPAWLEIIEHCTDPWLRYLS